MYKLVFLVVAGAAVVYCSDDIVNNNRACPEGYFYAGEPKYKETRGEFWEKGPTSPVYSCYRFNRGNFSFPGASLSCNEVKGELISINDDFEDNILNSVDFRNQIARQLMDDVMAGVFTSGIQLAPDTWTWFGVDEPVDEDIAGDIDVSPDSSPAVKCLTIRWEDNENGTNLVYSAESCTNTFNVSLCEVRVYTQTWYVWFYINWLQVLFFFTMFMLLVSLCCVFQMWSVQKSRLVAVRSNPNSPPPYTPHPSHTVNAGNRYMEKGRDILAKVTFYKQRTDEKRPLA